MWKSNLKICCLVFLLLTFSFLALTSRVEAQCNAGFTSPQTISCVNQTQTFTANNVIGLNYSWYVNGGTILSGQGTNEVEVLWTAQGALAGYVELEVFLGSTCYDIFWQNLNVDSSFTAIWGDINDTVLCDSNNILTYIQVDHGFGCPYQTLYRNIDAAIGGTVIAYADSYHVSLCQLRDTLVVRWDPGGIGQLLYSGFYENGCSYQDTIFLNLPPNPQIIGLDSVCIGDTAVYTSLNNAGKSWLWTAVGGTVLGPVNQSSATVLWASAGTHMLLFTESNSACSKTDTLWVTVGGILSSISLGPDRGFCSGTQDTLSISPGYATYLWNTGATTSTIFPNSSGTYVVTATSSSGCTVSDSITLTVIPAQQVNLGNDTVICPGGSILLDAGAGLSSYVWGPTLITAGQTWPMTQGYPFGLVWPFQGTDTSGCVVRDTIVIYQSYWNSGGLLPPNGTACEGDTLWPNNLGALDSFNWSTGDSTPYIFADSSGTYSLTVTDTAGCTYSDFQTLSISAAANISLVPDSGFCTGTGTINAILAAPGNPATTVYLWSNGTAGFGLDSISGVGPGTYNVQIQDANGCLGRDTVQILPPGPPVSLGPDTTSCYPVVLAANNNYPGYFWSNGDTTSSIVASGSNVYTLTVSDSAGCTSTDSILVNINGPVFSFGPDTSICQGGNLLLNPGTGGATYSWSTGASTPSLNVVNPGTYSLTVTNGSGCVWADTISVGVHPLPVAGLGPDFSLCPGDSATLSATAGYAGYQWSTGVAGTSITGFPGNTYLVTVTDTNGCQGLDTLNLGQKPLPSLPWLGNDTAICAGASLLLSPSGAFTNYQWSTGSTSSNITVSSPGIYSVTVSNAQNCTRIDSILITQIPAISPSFTYSGGPGTFSFSGASTGMPLQWLWVFGDGNSSNLQNPTHTYSISGNYTVCLHVTDSCGTVSTCQQIVVVNQEQLSDDTGIQVFPNPFSEKVQLRWNPNLNDFSDYILLNGNGKAVSLGKCTSHQGELNLSTTHLAAGIYLLKLTGKNENWSIKLTKF